MIGLTNGTAYTFTVTATNAVGTGLLGRLEQRHPTTVPGAPTIGTATAGNAQVERRVHPAGIRRRHGHHRLHRDLHPGGFTGDRRRLAAAP